MPLKIDFKDEILEEDREYREYDLIDKKGTIIQSDIHLVRKDTPMQEGDDYGAKYINELNKEVNTYEERLNIKQDKIKVFNALPDPLELEEGEFFFVVE